MPVQDFVIGMRRRGREARKWLATAKPNETFTGIRLDPSTLDQRLPDGNFNLWRGFAVEPSESGSWDLLREHIRVNLCGERDELFEYVLRWMAHLVQFPAIKPLVALVAYGDVQGTGKDTIGRALGGLLHAQNYSTIRGSGQIADEYDGATVANSLLMHAEEVLVEGGKAEADKLKNWITAPRVKIRFMRADGFYAANFMRVYMTSNHPVPVHIEPSDRRFVTIHVPAHPRTCDLAWFGRLWEELEGGGYGRFLHDLLALEIKGFETQKRIHTREHDEMKTASMTAVHQFLAECVSGQPKDRAKTKTYADFMEWCRARGVRGCNQIVFGREMAKMGVIIGRQLRGERLWTYAFSECVKVREALEKLYPAIRDSFDFQPVVVRDVQDDPNASRTEKTL